MTWSKIVVIVFNNLLYNNNIYLCDLHGSEKRTTLGIIVQVCFSCGQYFLLKLSPLHSTQKRLSIQCPLLVKGEGILEGWSLIPHQSFWPFPINFTSNHWILKPIYIPKCVGESPAIHAKKKKNTVEKSRVVLFFFSELVRDRPHTHYASCSCRSVSSWTFVCGSLVLWEFTVSLCVLKNSLFTGKMVLYLHKAGLNCLPRNNVALNYITNVMCMHIYMYVWYIWKFCWVKETLASNNLHVYNILGRGKSLFFSPHYLPQPIPNLEEAIPVPTQA